MASTRTPPAPGPRRPDAVVRTVPGLVLGLGGTALVGLVVANLGDPLTPAAKALLLVVPVTLAAVVGGRVAGFATVAAATAVLGFLFPPVGRPTVSLTQDLVALAAFSVVAAVVSETVARRVAMLGAIERQRAALLRAVSHDLRTPLATVTAASAELADNDRLSDDERRRLAHLVVDESGRLDRMVANLLSVARIEAGALEPQLDDVDVVELVGLVVDRCRRRFPSAHIEAEGPDEPVLARADHVLIDQALTNLVENAAEHTPARTPITIRVIPSRRSIAIAVVDHGPGLPEGAAERIFDPFVSGRPSGVGGMGLAIARATAAAHGGSLTAGDTPGGGATFTLVLPTR